MVGDRWAALFYVLLRDDHVTAEELEAVIADHVQKVPPGGLALLSDRRLAEVAHRLVDMVEGPHRTRGGGHPPTA